VAEKYAQHHELPYGDSGGGNLSFHSERRAGYSGRAAGDVADNMERIIAEAERNADKV